MNADDLNLTIKSTSERKSLIKSMNLIQLSSTVSIKYLKCIISYIVKIFEKDINNQSIS